MEPCKQEGPIGSLTATVDAIKDTLEKISEGQDRFVSVLEKIAAQGETIQTLKESSNILFERVRNIEIKAEGERVKTGAIMAGISITTSAITAAVVKHFWR